jgi:hypothetical protein
MASYNKLLAEEVIAELGKRNIDGYYCESKSDALDKILELTVRDATVSWGGSVTLQEIGLIDALKDGEYQVLDPNGVTGGVEKERVAREALCADYFFMSSNAITITGELVNADGIGNRVAALCFGPSHVVVVVGVNKIVKDVDAGIDRIKRIAGPKICLKFKPDIKTYEEAIKLANDSISQTVVTSNSVIKGRITVILVGESLGY